MKIIQDISLRDFGFWSGAKDRVGSFTDEQLDIIEQELEEEYPEGLDETALNDLFWFEEDWLAGLVGYQNYEYLCKGISNSDIERANEWFQYELSQKLQWELAGYNAEDYAAAQLADDDSVQDRIDDWWDNQQDWQRVELYRQLEGEV